MSVLLAIVAFGCLALSMNRHHADQLGSPASMARMRTLRIAGTVLIGAMLAFDISRHGAAFGALYGLGHASIGAALTLLMLTYSPRRQADAHRQG